MGGGPDLSGRRAGLRQAGAWRAGIPALVSKALAAAATQTVQLPGEPTTAALLTRLAHRLLDLQREIKDLDRLLTDRFRTHRQAQIIESLPGMGPILGAEFLVATGGDPAAFGTAARLAAYAGLAPVPNDSGQRTGNRHRPTRYHRRLRRVFYMAALSSLDQDGHDGPIPLELSLNWATSTSSSDPCNSARRLTVVRGFLPHLAALDRATAVPAPGLLGPAGHRRPPHVYSDQEIADLLHAAAGLAPASGLRPHCYATLFGLLACTGLRIAEALALTHADVDLTGGILTVRAGKRGRTRLVPLHPQRAVAAAGLRR